MEVFVKSIKENWIRISQCEVNVRCECTECGSEMDRTNWLANAGRSKLRHYQGHTEVSARSIFGRHICYETTICAAAQSIDASEIDKQKRAMFARIAKRCFFESDIFLNAVQYPHS